MMKITEDYQTNFDYYEVVLDGYEDEPEIVIGASEEEVEEEMKEKYGDQMVKSVTRISGEDLASTDPVDAEENHRNNISILTGHNPFAEALSRKDSMGKWISDFKNSDAPQFKGKSDEKRREMAIAAKLQKEDIDELNEISLEKLQRYRDGAARDVAKGVGTSKLQPSGTYKFTPASQQEKDRAHKRMKGYIKAGKLVTAKVAAKRAMKKEDIDIEEAKERRAPDTDLNKAKKDHSLWVRTSDHTVKNKRVPSKSEYDAAVRKSAEKDPNSNLNPTKKKPQSTLSSLKKSEPKKSEPTHTDNSPDDRPKHRGWKSDSSLKGTSQKASDAFDKVVRKKYNPQTGKYEVKEENDIDTSGLLMEREDKLMYLVRIGLMDRNEMILVRRAMELKKSNAPMSRTHRDILFKLLDKMVGLVIKNPHMYNLAKRKVMAEAWDEVFEVYNDKELIETFIQRMDYLEEKQGPCWTGYKKVPGKKDYEDGSCVKEEEQIEEVETFKSKEVTKRKDGSSKEVHYAQKDVNLEVVKEAGYNDLPKTKAEVKKKYPDIETDVKNKNSLDLQKLKYK